MKENNELLIKKLNKASLIYKNEFLNKDLLIIARKTKNIEIIEISFRKEHFKHLAGIKDKRINAKDFFDKISEYRLSIQELKLLDKNPYIIKKLNAFPKIIKLLKEQPYLYDFHPHSTTKVELDKVIADVNREKEKELIGLKFFKILSNNLYIPASIEKRKASEVTTEERKRIICILEKKSIEKDYSKIFFKSPEEDLSPYLTEKINNIEKLLNEKENAWNKELKDDKDKGIEK